MIRPQQGARIRCLPWILWFSPSSHFSQSIRSPRGISGPFVARSMSPSDNFVITRCAILGGIMRPVVLSPQVKNSRVISEMRVRTGVALCAGW